MPKYIIERTIPGAGSMSPEQLKGVAEKSCSVLRELNNSQYHWVTSFVTGDKIYCVHIAPNEDVVREHARRGGFPADRISEVTTQIDATTAERVPAFA